MEFKRVACTTCGSTLEMKEETSALTCEYCGNTFLTSNGLEFASKSEEEIGSIQKLRNNLQRSVVADDHKNILAFSKEILRLIPKDDLANYYFAYANYSFGSRRYLFDFYDHEVRISKDANKIIDHVIAYSDVRDKSLIETFIARHNPEKIEKYRDTYKQKLIDEENYSSIPRDVFISFRSTEIEIANEVLELIESDGHTCWISSRNLRPNDNENYWANIEDAITKCKLFLVVSSHEAMISRDVKKELDIATKQNKARLEYKVDNSRHTSLFKYFFDGSKWIDATEDKQSALVELKRRVYQMLSDSDTITPKKGVPQKETSDSTEFSRKLNRSKVDMLSENYTDAANTIKDALGINPESAEAWWMLFLAENEFQSNEAFSHFLGSKQTLAKMSDLFNKVAFKQYRKYAEKDESGRTKYTKLFEQYLYDDALAYINKPNLPSKSKRDYLQAYIPNHILTLWAENILRKGFSSDREIDVIIDDPSRIKELENVFTDFEDLEAHPQYKVSHIGEYKQRFFTNFEKVLKKREANLDELKQINQALTNDIESLLEKKKFQKAEQKAIELFYIDNSNMDKYMYLLLAKMKSKDTIDLYDAFYKMKKPERQKMFESVVFERLYRSDKYSHLMNDLVLHLNYKKVKKNNRINVQVRGEEDEM